MAVLAGTRHCPVREAPYLDAGRGAGGGGPPGVSAGGRHHGLDDVTSGDPVDLVDAGADRSRTLGLRHVAPNADIPGWLVVNGRPS